MSIEVLRWSLPTQDRRGFVQNRKAILSHIMDYYERGIISSPSSQPFQSILGHSIAHHYVFIWFCLLHLLHKFGDDTKRTIWMLRHRNALGKINQKFSSNTVN